MAENKEIGEERRMFVGDKCMILGGFRDERSDQNHGGLIKPAPHDKEGLNARCVTLNACRSPRA